MTITLETARLFLRPPVEADLDGWAAFDSDDRANRFFGGPKNRAAAWQHMSSVVGMWSLRGCGLFSVFERATGRWIGRIGPRKPEGATAEIGWAILPSEWGKGYATEGAGAAIDWAIERLGWREIEHCIDADNTASVAVARRLGAEWRRADRDLQGKETQVYGQTAQHWRSH